MLSRLKFDLSDTISTMIGYIPEPVWVNKTTTFCDFEMGGGQFIKGVVDKLKLYGHSDENIQSRVFGFSDNELYLAYVMGSDIIGTFDIYKEKKHSNMKFDVIVGNPPYQLQVGPNKTETIWDKFVIKCTNQLNENGYLSLIHPSGWRNVEGKFKYIQNELKQMDIIYLEMHDKADGLKTFGAATTYDWYVIQKSNKKTKTTLKLQSGEIIEYDLNELPFIPSANYDILDKLIAKENEDTVNILYSRSNYGTDKPHISLESDNNFVHKCIYMIKVNGEPKLQYSNINTNGHFGIPKLIWGNGGYEMGSFLDMNGEYGLTQFAYAISDTIENLPLIKKAFDSKEFRNIMKGFDGGDSNINRKVISLFRKDFWKEFI
jgi:hypothetical protein